MEITLLMPVYNASRYLTESIDSVLKQTSDYWKLICIDDGSTDNSLEIISNYAKQDNRISFIQQSNAGPAVARARAIKAANTEYVAILDADDRLSSEYVEKMLAKATETDADILTPNVEYISDSNNFKKKSRFEESSLNENTVIENGIYGFALTIPWQLHGWQMIRTSLAKKYYIEEEVNYSKLNSDEYITRLLYLKSKKTVCCNAVYMHRYDNNDSLTRTVKLLNYDCLKTLERLFKLCKDENIPNDILLNLYNVSYVTLGNMIKSLKMLNNSDRQLAIELVKDFYYNIYRKNMSLGILKISPIKNTIKLLISLVGLNTIKLMTK